MPKINMDYSKCEMYKIISIDETLNFCYIGHTTNFIKRKWQHKNACNNPNAKNYNYKIYQTIRDNNGWDAFKMVFIEKYPCENRRQAEKREEELIKEFNGNMNSHKAFRTEEEKKEYKKEYNKEYNDQHKEEVKQYKKEYNKQHKEEIKQKRKEYNEQNKEIINEKQKKYYEHNKEEIKEKLKEKYTCECGSCINVGEKLRHKRSQKHINFINNLEIKNI